MRARLNNESVQVTHKSSPVAPINFLCNWEESVSLIFWVWHLMPKLPLRNISFSFLSSFQKARYLGEVLERISWLVASGEVVPVSRLAVCLSATFPIVGPLQFCEWCVRPKHPLGGALLVPFVLVRVTRGALVAHRYSYAPPRCRISHYRQTFIPNSVSRWNGLVDSVFGDVRLAGFNSRVNASLLTWSALFFFVHCFPFLCFISIGCLCGVWVIGLTSNASTLSQAYNSNFKINNNSNHYNNYYYFIIIAKKVMSMLHFEIM